MLDLLLVLVGVRLKMAKLTIALVQFNSVVGDLKGNTSRIKKVITFARKEGVDLIVFPELTLTGYPPEDLVFNPQFVSDNLLCLENITNISHDIAIILGFVDRGNKGKIYNAAALIVNGKQQAIYHKIILPNYGVFDEKRYFDAGTESSVHDIKNISVGINICEDIWDDSGPTESQTAFGAKIIININGSPYCIGKYSQRESMLNKRASGNQIAIGYVNTVGGQDELIFDGGSMVLSSDGRVVMRAKQFQEEVIVFDIEQKECSTSDSMMTIIPKNTFGLDSILESTIGRSFPGESLLVDHKHSDRHEYLGELYSALVLGIRDYVTKNQFNRAVIGLSGGIDSALTTVLAVDAIGKDNVVVVSMPSRYSSVGSVEDSQELAKNLGVKLDVLPIEPMYTSYLESLAPLFEGTSFNTAEENIQARIRGTLLMALSNKYGWLVLTTGNKSEMGMGYATLYGDMAGGFAVLKDVLKTQVYKLAEYRNSINNDNLIPVAILTKPPSAELRPNQKDQDSLPPYEILDPILKAYVEQDQTVNQIISAGHDSKDVRMVVSAVERSEYKRRQSPPGIKVTPRAFGRDWRLPITNRYQSL